MTTATRHLPSIAALRSFECAARHENFTLAAEELNLTQSAISRQIRELELSMGFELFRRTGRRVLLTEAGRNFANDLSVDLGRIRQTTLKAISAGSSSKSLRVAVLPMFATHWLIPRLRKFQLAHPGITINLSTRLEPFDLDRERFDVAFHYGLENWPDVELTHLCEEEMIAVASPEFCHENAIKSASDLKPHSILHLDSRPNSWLNWFKENGVEVGKVLPGERFDQFSMLIAGAIHSLGAALAPDYLVEKELAQGSLVRIGKYNLKTKKSYFIVRKSGAHDETVADFIKWVILENGGSHS